jgi:oligo-1,6-glucosidase
MKNATTRQWWKETFVYQIYPRSFKDSNQDGIGDLKGITQSLDYLKDLGVEVLWLSPIFKSPNDDNGYDVSDYQDIMDEFGTMADFDEMLAEMKKRNIKLVLDLVVNHSSDEHHWFEEAKKSKDNPYRDYYVWREGKDGKVPNNWTSMFGGSTWEYNEATDDYYLHLFTKKQPDLNWESPALRQEIYKMMRFWLDKGVDGFRMDVIPFISKREGLPDIDYTGHIVFDLVNHYSNGPRIHEFLQEMHREVLVHYDAMSVGEGIGVYSKDAYQYVGEDRKELDMVYYFDHMYLDRDISTGMPTQLLLSDLKRTIQNWDQALEDKGWNTFYLNNHDQPRSVSRFGNSEEYRYASATMLATLLFTLKVTPFMYQGEELGMTNTNFERIEDFNDIWIRNQWKEWQAQGKNEPQAFLKYTNVISRDHARTPFQWDDSPQAGFTNAEKPWLIVNPNYKEINAKEAIANKDSIWYYYQKVIALRKANECLVYGNYRDIDIQNKQIFAYLRELEDERILVILNFSNQEVSYQLPDEITQLGRVLIGNYPESEDKLPNVSLRPYEARVYCK